MKLVVLRVLALVLLALVACTEASPPPPPVDASADVRDGSADVRDASLRRVRLRECTQDMACTCFHPEVRGTAPCTPEGLLGPCQCVRAPDGGVPPLPPRLLAPQSVSRVASQRPTLRWQAPASATRLRVELCRDRACARPITSAELGAVSSWRPPVPLPPGMVFWRVRALEGALWQSATWEFQVRHRDAPTAASWLPVKDFDGDSYDDAVVDTGSAQSWVYHGVRGGLPERERVRLTSPDAMQLTGFRGGVLNTQAGDLNGDGYADLAGGDWGVVDRSVTPLTVGHVHVFWGSATGLSMTRQQRVRMAPEPEVARYEFHEQDNFGYEVGIVDFDGDGYSDLAVIRDPGSATRENRLGPYPTLFLFRGGPGGVSATPHSGFVVSYWLGTGSALVGVGDVDGDGYGELAGSLYTTNGGVFLLYGNPRGDLNERVAYIDGEWLEEIGTQLSTGDDNGDGLADLVVGGQGRVYVFHGGPRSVLRADGPGYAGWGSAFGASFGLSINVQGDVNGDGYTDIVGGGRCNTPTASAPECRRSHLGIYFGGPAGVGTEPGILMRRMDDPNLPAGAQVEGLFESSVAGDLDGDGLDDALVGCSTSYRNHESLGAEGCVRIYPGRTTTVWGAPARYYWGGERALLLGSDLY